MDINVRRVWRTSTRGAAKPWKPSGMGNFCRVHEETIETCAFFSLGDNNFADKTTPGLVSKNGPQSRVHSLSLNFICLCPGDLAPVLGSVFGPQNGGRFVGKIFAAGRKIVQVSIVSAGIRGRGFAYRWVSMV